MHCIQLYFISTSLGGVRYNCTKRWLLLHISSACHQKHVLATVSLRESVSKEQVV